ncbi:hypothetical protein LBMAG49_05340 [Planctomycetota bacterium]|jgi:hypothetical protein|nr:hypothetical protein [Planctomycetota bacterium]GDY01205.1 hypothetical protein LBMAG49_05340 [Planctomycetota bacterium]
MTENKPLIDPNDVRILMTGFGLGLAILGFFICLGLTIHMSMSILFGVPYQ